jgi:hypothetical protein
MIKSWFLRPTQENGKLTLTAALSKHSNHSFELLVKKDLLGLGSETFPCGSACLWPHYKGVILMAHRRWIRNLHGLVSGHVPRTLAFQGVGRRPAGTRPLGYLSLIRNGTPESEKLKARKRLRFLGV